MLHLVHLLGLQDPITDASLAGAVDVLEFRLTERRGQEAEASLKIRNPGLSILTRSTNVAVVESPDGTVANAKILCRARVVAAPKSLTGNEATLELKCSSPSFQTDLQTAANAACSGAAIPPWTVRVVPTPDPGSIGVVFTGTPGSVASWGNLRAGAIKVRSFFQEDLVRSVYARVPWNTINATNALLVLTLPATAAAAARAAAQAGQFALIGVSGDSDATHGAFYTYGVVMRLVPGLDGTVDVYVNLADPKLTGSGFAYAAGDPGLAGLPFYDPLYGGDVNDLATTALEARAAAWHVDPVTHAITLEPLLTGPVVDLGGLGDDASTDSSTGQSPVKAVKFRVVAEWEQHAAGPVDIASVIATAASPSGFISSMQDKVVEGGSDQKLDFQGWSGWTKGDWRQVSVLSQSAPFFTGRTIQATYQDYTVHPGYTDDQGNYQAPTTTYGDPYTYVHSETGNFNIRSVRYTAAWVAYEYSQPRREVVDFVLDCQAQVTVQATETATLPTVNLGDLLVAAGIAPYAPETVYSTGDRVSLFGRVWESLVDGNIRFYEPVSKASAGISGLSVSVQYLPVNWRDLGTLAPMPDPRAPSFFDTDRGRGCLQHALCRMGAAALRRLEMISISRTYPWTLARDLTLHQRVRLLFKDGDKATPMVGKVTVIERVVTGESATVRLTMAVPLGTGANGTVDAAGRTTPFAPVQAVAPQNPLLAPSVAATSSIITVGGNIEAVVTPDDLVLPVDAYRLSDPWYAVGEVFVDNQADRQMALALSRAASGGDPRAVTRDYPTTLRVNMRFMVSHAVIERIYRVHAALLTSPRGIDLAGGGEP
ncbi:hypothetical protein [Methylobacterium sp. J-076]|uniref:hypothetical protein n=1 Tax=Methylobacterium sp. J-076 TaxID=2836655 RepID=UPI001FB89D8A|nr:hypothetical protein [Methylobacterium sp. J-076]MCJ2015575.1 hypothetical protein [Methylobacterium sp. J-076]